MELTPAQIEKALSFLDNDETDIEKIAQAVGCNWWDFGGCGNSRLEQLSDDFDWWWNYGQYEYE